jgi:leucyl aminopeptidase
MSLKIIPSKSNFSENFLIFCNKKFEPYGNLSIFQKKDVQIINKILKSRLDIKTNIMNFNLGTDINITAVKNDTFLSATENEKNGAKLFEFAKINNLSEFQIIEKNLIKISSERKSFLNEFLFGFELKSYLFDNYKTSKVRKNYKFYLPISLKKNFFKYNLKFKSLLSGVNYTKDLVSEPGNVLHPDEYVNRIKKLKNLGLKIIILDRDKLKKLGMNALLGVGQGSVKGSYLAIIEWQGSSSKKERPLAFVGKGVCFDTGGISLKPAKFMEDMTYDMAGSAVVVGLLKTLALRKAKVNAVGVVGLVENMPDGNAQRPGDIVRSYSGKTIEILNTDAEGRLVLADALTYTEKRYKPKFIVDLATLTGAIIVSLGSEYAGLFSNDDKISDQLSKAGEKVGEKVWRMPLNENYDKLINSKKADMQNINYVGGAGSTTAAQFLQRFILNKTPWAHLDIAGMAFSKYGGALNSEGATGYGVRLLNQLIEDNYE